MKNQKITVSEDGNWNVLLKTPKYGGPYNLKIFLQKEINIEDVMIGEVWLHLDNQTWNIQLKQEY